MNVILRLPNSRLLASLCMATIGLVALGIGPQTVTIGHARTTTPTTQTNKADDSDPREVIGLQHEGPIRVVYQISKDEWKDDVGKGLLYLKKLRTYYGKKGIDPKRLDIHAVFHGSASTHLLTDEAYNRVKGVKTGNPNTQLIAELAKQGVHIELCDSRRREEGWKKSDIHSDVDFAEAAYARLIDLQLQGYAYIRF